jgi:enoyl-CoA hydratase/carnithine racemase
MLRQLVRSRPRVASSLLASASAQLKLVKPASTAAAGVQVPQMSGEEQMKLLSTEIVDEVAVVTLLSPEGNFPWGTRVREHRINPWLIAQLSAALDAAERKGAQAVVVTGEGNFFCNGMDLQYISANVADSTKIQTQAENLLSRILTFPAPTIAALNGHFTAAGGMLGLAFDVRVMASDGKGLFFVPGIDIGLVYSQGMTELLKAKLPQPLWNDSLCFGRRFQCSDLLQHRVVNAAPPATELLSKALEMASGLKSKGKDEKTRQTLYGIKRNLYRPVVMALGKDVEDMGFAEGTWDPTGRASKL